VSKIWDDRKKSQEEEYFRRKENEAIERMRARRQTELEAREAAGKTLQCPKCDGSLVEVAHEDILIDRCDKCHGVWLDSGELELLTDREESVEGSGWLTRLRNAISGK